MRATARRWAARAAVVAGVLLAAGCTAGPGGQAPSPPSGLRGATATAGAAATGTRPGHPVTVYVLMPSADDHDGTVVPIDAATGTAGPAIGLHTSDFIADGIAVTPDGKTAYVIDAYNNDNGNVVPIRTATSTAGPLISAGNRLVAIAIAPDGKTAYVLSGEGGLYPISTATGRAGAAINVWNFPRPSRSPRTARPPTPAAPATAP